jgi:hypothetical protein
MEAQIYGREDASPAEILGLYSLRKDLLLTECEGRGVQGTEIQVVRALVLISALSIGPVGYSRFKNVATLTQGGDTD